MLAMAKVFQKRRKIKIDGLMPMRPRSIWEWGFCESTEVCAQWLNSHGISPDVQNTFRAFMLHRRNQISDLTFQGDMYEEKERWT